MPTDEPVPAEQFDDMAQQRRSIHLGMWAFLATELLLFGGLFAGFTVYRVQHGAVFAEAATHLDLTLGSINTALLLTSGLTLFAAEQAITDRHRGTGLLFLLATTLLGAVFLGIKGYEWYAEASHNLVPVLGWPFHYEGQSPAVAELFFNFYFIMTGLHAAHMLMGVIALGAMVFLVGRWRDAHKLDRQIRMVGLYWAFVDVVWIFVFTSLYLLRA